MKFTATLKRLEFHRKKSRLRFLLPGLIGLMSRHKAAPVTNPTAPAVQPATSQPVDRRDPRMLTVVEAGRLDPSISLDPSTGHENTVPRPLDFSTEVKYLYLKFKSPKSENNSHF